MQKYEEIPGLAEYLPANYDPDGIKKGVDKLPCQGNIPVYPPHSKNIKPIKLRIPE